MMEGFSAHKLATFAPAAGLGTVLASATPAANLAITHPRHGTHGQAMG
jgi:hypothetical protein